LSTEVFLLTILPLFIMGVEKIILNPWEFVWIDFIEGQLNVLGSEEQRIHGRPSRVYYGKNLSPYASLDPLEEFPYILPLQDLRKLGRYFGFREINEHTEARKTLSGGLQLRRKRYCFEGFSDTATFSADEYRIIQQYCEAETPTAH
jgi:hypothetical protein